MQIVNNSDYTVYWRLFNTTDTAHVFGLQDGLVGPGKTASVTPVDPKVQIEFKWSNVLGSFLRRADKDYLYGDGHTFTISPDYKLSIKAPTAAPVPAFHPDRVEQRYYGTTYKFFDLLAAPGSDIEQRVDMSLTEARTTSHSSEASQSNTVSWGLSLTLTGDGDDGGSSAAGGQWSSKVTKAFKESFGSTASQVRTTAETTSFTALGGHLNVLQCHWNTDVEHGQATCGTESYKYQATLSVSPSIEFATYSSDTVNSMPDDVAKAWRDQTGKAAQNDV